MKKLFLSFLAGSIFLFSMTLLAFAAENTPGFSFKQVSVPDQKKIELEIAPGSLFSVDFLASNLDGERGITLNFNVLDYSSGQDSKAFSPAWVSFEPAELRLDAGESSEVKAIITMSADLPEGVYESIFQARLSDYDDSNKDGSATAVNLAVGVQSAITISKDAQQYGQIATYDEVVDQGLKEVANTNDVGSWLQHNLVYILGAVIVLLLLKLFMFKKKN